MSTPAQLDLPGEITALRVETRRGEFAVLTAGAGPLALLVPGWTGSKEDFSSLLVPLATRGYRAVALDLRGQHETPGSSDPAAYSIESLADDLAVLIESLGAAPAHVVGHSFGGLISQSLVLRDGAAVQTLALLCSGPGALPADRHALLQSMAQVIDSHGLEVTWQAKYAYERAQGFLSPPPPVEAFLKRRFLANHPTSLREITLHLTRAPDQIDALAESAVPKLVVFGTEDDGWPIQTQKDMALRLGARAVEINGAAHSPAVEAPDATASALVQFWQAVRRERDT